MSQWKRKPDPYQHSTKSTMNIDQIWREKQNTDSSVVPKQNRSGDIPYNALVFSLNALGDIYSSTPIHREIVELIQRRLTPFSSDQTARQRIILSLMTENGIVDVQIWVIPIFSEGILTNYIFASDDYNLDLLKQHRSLVKLNEYDITSI